MTVDLLCMNQKWQLHLQKCVHGITSAERTLGSVIKYISNYQAVAKLCKD